MTARVIVWPSGGRPGDVPSERKFGSVDLVNVDQAGQVVPGVVEVVRIRFPRYPAGSFAGVRVTITNDPAATALLQEQHIVADAAELAVKPGDPLIDRSIRHRETVGTMLDAETFSTPVIVQGETTRRRATNPTHPCRAPGYHDGRTCASSWFFNGDLDVRPVHHRNADRVRAHFLWMLAHLDVAGKASVSPICKPLTRVIGRPARRFGAVTQQIPRLGT